MKYYFPMAVTMTAQALALSQAGAVERTYVWTHDTPELVERYCLLQAGDPQPVVCTTEQRITIDIPAVPIRYQVNTYGHDGELLEPARLLEPQAPAAPARLRVETEKN